MVSPDLNGHPTQPAQSTMAPDIPQLPAGQSYAGVNYLSLQQPSQLHSAPMVAGDVFTSNTGSTMLLNTPNGFDYALHEVSSRNDRVD